MDAMVLRRAACRRGGLKRAQTFTREFQQAARAKVKRASLVAAGRKGYAATLARHGLAGVQAHVARWRAEHPSQPEQCVLDWLAEHDLAGFEREVMLPDGRSIDVAWPVRQIAIEVNGHQHKPSFGETESRAVRHAAKVRDLENAGWRVFVFDARADFSTEAQRLGAFLAAVGLMNEVDNGGPIAQAHRGICV